uniref:LysM domain-containing protein n=1 Tax=Candidatus Kentrum sp. DK TaxID=2126562 RepID=A0A450S444_9GAMM|nr:MAG: LysM domain-containing protein [Candidatus Kentron sp. DK]
MRYPGKPAPFFFLLLSLLLPLNLAAVPDLEMSRVPSLFSAIRVSSSLDFCGEKTPLDESDVKERLERELLVSLGNPHQVVLWIKRAGRYFPHIEEVLKKNGLPDDLKYIAVAESALLPHIGSPKHAVGFWQFIESTGLSYDLRIDGFIDERRNIFTSTRAATRYLEKLYADFGSWTLAAAAYNMGENGLKSRIETQKTKNYYHLYLPLETQRYLFRILSIKLILSDPERYGFYFTDGDRYSPLSFDRVLVKVNSFLPLQLIAEASSTYLKKIKDLNPEIRGYELPRGSYSILIPKGAGEKFLARLAPLVAKYKPKRRARTYVVKHGDNLSGIAKKHGVKVSDLKRWNQKLGKARHIYPGQRLVVRK